MVRWSRPQASISKAFGHGEKALARASGMSGKESRRVMIIFESIPGVHRAGDGPGGG